MNEGLSATFVEQLNHNIGIAYKVCRLYFAHEDEREDVLQEMMYQLWKSYKSFDGRSKFSTWMYRVCLNTVLTYQRKRQPKKEEPLAATHHQIAEEISPDKDETVRLLFEAIRKLSPLNKAIILLYLENVSYEEIASVMGLTRSNVSVKLVRIKKELETDLKKTIKSIEDVNY
jgi:RNA polymerase sigma factor (sigma-70 family)